MLKFIWPYQVAGYVMFSLFLLSRACSRPISKTNLKQINRLYFENNACQWKGCTSESSIETSKLIGVANFHILAEFSTFLQLNLNVGKLKETKQR